MSTPVVSVTPGAIVEEALELMVKHRVSGLPVIDRTGRLVGIVSEFDVLVLLSETEEQYWPIDPVDRFMTTDVVTVDETASLREIARMMQRQGIRRLPVTRDQRVVGIVSRRDLAEAIRDQRLETSDRFWQSGSKKIAETQDS